MKFEKSTVNMQPEIRKRILGGELLEPITITDSSLVSEGVVKAGSPIDENGEIANSGDAKGILLNDVYAENPNGSLITAFAEINKDVAETHSGITYTAALFPALSNIVFQ